MCGFGEALEGMLSFHEDDFHEENAIQYEANIPAPELSMIPNKNSLDSICQQAAQPHQQDVSPPISPQGYQKRGRFLIWPVTMDPPNMVGIPFFGMTPQ